MSKITIVDYGMGNIRSVQKKFQRVGTETIITSSTSEILRADKLILPGVGHFANGVKKLKETGIWNAINEKVIIEKTPILGICLGMQLMAKHSEEGDIDGLGWLNAKVVRFNVNDKLTYKVPHMGWNNTILNKDSILFKGVSLDAMFYFVHSFHIQCYDVSDILATTEYEYEFTSSIQNENIFGTQFHPEKSHDWGEQIFNNFANL